MAAEAHKKTTPTTIAVLTGDLVDSTKRKPLERKKLVESLSAFFDKFEIKSRNDLQLKAKFELYRGDSFQIMLDAPVHALLLTLLIRTYLQGKVTFPSQTSKNDARIAIGIGKVSNKASTLAESDGEAFLFSGRLLDGMKKLPNRIALKSTRKLLNDEMEINLVLLEAIISKWTTAQAEAIYYKLQNYTEVTIAELLKIKQPTVNERSKAASWTAVERLLKRYQALITAKRV